MRSFGSTLNCPLTLIPWFNPNFRWKSPVVPEVSDVLGWSAADLPRTTLDYLSFHTGDLSKTRLGLSSSLTSVALEDGLEQISLFHLPALCQARGSSGRRKHWNEGRDKKSLFLVSVNGSVRCQCCELLLRCLNRYKLYEYVQKDHQLLRKITLRVI